MCFLSDRLLDGFKHGNVPCVSCSDPLWLHLRNKVADNKPVCDAALSSAYQQCRWFSVWPPGVAVGSVSLCSAGPSDRKHWDDESDIRCSEGFLTQTQIICFIFPFSTLLISNSKFREHEVFLKHSVWLSSYFSLHISCLWTQTWPLKLILFLPLYKFWYLYFSPVWSHKRKTP